MYTLCIQSVYIGIDIRKQIVLHCMRVHLAWLLYLCSVIYL